MTDNTEVLSNPFEDSPEAAAENDPGATIYMRVPASLKKRVDDAAREGKLSGNVWAMRCVERCLEERTIRDYKTLALIWSISAGLGSAWADDEIGGDGVDQWKLRKATDALGRIADLAEELGNKLLGDGERELSDAGHIFSGDMEWDGIQREFQPYPETARGER
jgi:hypothetical protein